MGSWVGGLAATSVLAVGAGALAQQGARAWLGVELAPRQDGKPGVLVQRVVRTSPADEAGVRAGDGLRKVGGRVVERPADVVAEVGARRPGEGVEVIFERGGSERRAMVTLGVFPGPDELLRRERVGQFAPGLAGVVAVQGVVPAAVSALRGRVVVIDFWAAWCTACRVVTPTLNDWHARLSAQGLSVIGLSSDAVPVATRATAEFGIKYAVGVDAGETIFGAYGVRSLPTMFVIDKRGVVRGVEVGAGGGVEQRVEQLVVKLLAEKGD